MVIQMIPITGKMHLMQGKMASEKMHSPLRRDVIVWDISNILMPILQILLEVLKQLKIVCLHEEDFGILWKHQDWRTGLAEVRRSRLLTVSFICTVANYEYGFYWHFYQDGKIEAEVKLTRILSLGALQPGESLAQQLRQDCMHQFINIFLLLIWIWLLIVSLDKHTIRLLSLMLKLKKLGRIMYTIMLSILKKHCLNLNHKQCVIAIFCLLAIGLLETQEQ